MGMDWYDWIGKKIFVKLKSGNFFNAVIDNVTYLGKDENDVDMFFISATDKFGMCVAFTNTDIMLIKQEGEGK